MKRFFILVTTLDLLALALPTRWMGPMVEFCLALALAGATGVLWLAVKLSRDP